jgi:hypothetical protein
LDSPNQSALRKKNLWPLLFFVGVPLAAFPDIIFGGQTLYWSDLSWIHYPRHIFAAQEWLAGRVPLWDPFQHNGLPFLAESQVGTLYPFSALFLSPLAPTLELSWFILLHFTLAALFTFSLARYLGMSQAAATLAGLAFGCGGVMMAQVPNLNIMTGAAWLPLMLLGAIHTLTPAETADGEKRLRAWWVALLAGLPLTLQILTAQPQIVFYSVVTVGAYGLYRLGADFWAGEASFRQKRGYALASGLRLGAMLASGFLLAAPQLLPTLELQQLSVRSAMRDLAFLTENSLPPAMWLNLLLPSAFGNNVTGFRGGDPFQEDFIYLGFGALLLVGFSLGRRQQRDWWFFPLLLLGSGLLAMGRYTPLYEYVIQYLPGFALFRIPARWLVVVNLALAILAGFGLESIRRQGLSKRAWGGVTTLSLGLLVGVGLLWLGRESLAGWSNPPWSDFHQRLLRTFLEKGYTVDPIYQERLLLGWLGGVTAPAYLLVINIVVALGLYSALAIRKIGRITFSWLVVVALSVDLALAGGVTINPLKPSDWWSELSAGARYVVEHLEQGRVFPLGMGSEAAAVSHLGQYFPSVYRVRSAGGHGSSLLPARINIFLDEAHPVQAIQVMAVRFLLTQGQMGADAAATYPIVYSDDRAYVYENPAPLPRVVMVHQLVQASQPAETLAHFQSLEVDPSQTVVLEATGQLPQPEQPVDQSRAAIVREQPQRIEIAVSAAGDGYLVLLDTYYPGWQARVDGQSTPIYRANYLARAVFVPAGEHQVIFDYRPRSFQLGLGLALVMVGGLVGAIYKDS